MKSFGMMKRLVGATARGAATRLLPRAPVGLWRRLFPKRALGVCYHLVSDVPLPHLKHYPMLSVAEFEADLDYMQRSFGFISYDQLARRDAAGGAVRDNAVLLTFDDGFAECADVVAPLLRRRGIPCVFFVITDLIDNASMFRESKASLCLEAIARTPTEPVLEIVRELGIGALLREPPRGHSLGPTRSPLDMAGLGDRADPRLRPLLHWLLTIQPADVSRLDQLSARLNIDAAAYLRAVRPYMTSEQIRELHGEGFTIGAHSRSHRWLEGLPRTEAETEIVDSCRIIRDLTRQTTVPFAFPYNGGGLDRAWLEKLRRDNDFLGLFFDTSGLREDKGFIVQRVFGERLGTDATLDAILRRSWARPDAWKRAS